MKKIINSLLVIHLLSLAAETCACTTFILSGKYTPDGRPILYKHRDTGTPHNALKYFNDGKYSYVGLVDACENCDSSVWGGYNSSGFAIMNSAAYNNNIGDTTKLKNREGIIMKLALMNCASVDDFEKLLAGLPKPLGVDSNFGVIDACGGAAYFETGHYGFNKIDANNPEVAPFGYLIRTNHSFTGVIDKGSGYIRYATAGNVLYMASATNNFEPQYLLNSISRNLTHSLTGVDLRDDLPVSGNRTDFRFFEDFIPRNTSASVILVHGVSKNEDPANTMMWTILGFPLVTVAAPVWLSAGVPLPSVLTMKDNFHAPLCDAAMILKEKCYPVKRGSGLKYINLAAVLNAENSGIMQLLEPVENEIFVRTRLLTEQMTKEKPKSGIIRDHYKWLDSHITESYRKLFSIEINN